MKRWADVPDLKPVWHRFTDEHGRVVSLTVGSRVQWKGDHWRVKRVRENGRACLVRIHRTKEL